MLFSRDTLFFPEKKHKLKPKFQFPQVQPVQVQSVALYHQPKILKPNWAWDKKEEEHISVEAEIISIIPEEDNVICLPESSDMLTGAEEIPIVVRGDGTLTVPIMSEIPIYHPYGTEEYLKRKIFQNGMIEHLILVVDRFDKGIVPIFRNEDLNFIRWTSKTTKVTLDWPEVLESCYKKAVELGMVPGVTRDNWDNTVSMFRGYQILEQLNFGMDGGLPVFKPQWPTPPMLREMEPWQMLKEKYVPDLARVREEAIEFARKKASHQKLRKNLIDELATINWQYSQSFVHRPKKDSKYLVFRGHPPIPTSEVEFLNSVIDEWKQGKISDTDAEELILWSEHTVWYMEDIFHKLLGNDTSLTPDFEKYIENFSTPVSYVRKVGNKIRTSIKTAHGVLGFYANLPNLLSQHIGMKVDPILIGCLN